MEFDPPIHSRSTKDLISIVECPEDWEAKAVSQARDELVNRDIYFDKQESYRKTYSRLTKRVKKIKANARFSTFEMTFYIVLFPIAVYLLGWPFLYVEEGYSTMNKQAWIIIICGPLLWFLVFKILSNPYLSALLSN